LLRDAPLANLRLELDASGLPGLLDHLGVPGPLARRGEEALMNINPIVPKKGLTRTAGPTIDACRTVPGGRPAELVLGRKVLVPDPLALLGPYSSRVRGDSGMIKDIEFYRYGNLDIGIKDGALVVVRVR
jgi:hypothetical protein